MPSTSHRNTKIREKGGLFWTIVCITLIVNSIGLVTSKTDLQVMLHNPFLAYQMRLRLKLGSPFYEYINFLQKNIPTDAVVALPPNSPAWDNFGNGTYMNYFLYPRKLVWTDKVSDSPSENADFALIIKGHPTTNNPDSPIWPEHFSTSSAIFLQTNPELGFIKLHHD